MMNKKSDQKIVPQQYKTPDIETEDSSLEDRIEEDWILEDINEQELTQIAPEIRAMRSPIWEGLTDRDTGLGRALHRLRGSVGSDLSATGGDLDADQYLAKVGGEEGVGGSNPTPEQNVVEDLAAAVGVEISDKTTLHIMETLKQRDAHRWELEVESCEDYQEHKE
ncbi:MAG: DUF6335 family protein [Nostocaceae cyanobacterium]|nr:DUF6335 family protein [Nostocaceae cyanobacterium]